LLENVGVALPEGIFRDVTVWLSGGLIVGIGGELRPSENSDRIDGTGLLLSPGFVDLHSDAIEKEIRPRPGGNFPLEVALTELDKRLAACGITTMYHCLCFGESETNELRTAEKADAIARTLRRMEPHLTVRNRIHVRFEVSDIGSMPTLRRLLDERGADLFSIMDHTPGQGQFTDLAHFKTYYSQAEHLTGDQAEKLAATRIATRDSLGDEHIRELAAICRLRGIPMASHDDDTVEKVNWIHEMGIGVSEFPVRLQAAREARRLGMEVLMGAPNILRGGSLTGNLSGQEALREGACTVIGSDYAPMTMLHAAYQVFKSGLLPLHEALLLVTRNPARAVGLDGKHGALRQGAVADLVLIDDSGLVPRIVKTFVGGREVFSAPRLRRDENKSPQMENCHVVDSDRLANVY
jgi:alpha-D-ribose 1-methylphosphonate 5-triphosphate diphosphatase